MPKPLESTRVYPLELLPFTLLCTFLFKRVSARVLVTSFDSAVVLLTKLFISVPTLLLIATSSAILTLRLLLLPSARCYCAPWPLVWATDSRLAAPLEPSFLLSGVCVIPTLLPNCHLPSAVWSHTSFHQTLETLSCRHLTAQLLMNNCALYVKHRLLVSMDSVVQVPKHSVQGPYYLGIMEENFQHQHFAPGYLLQ